MATKQFLKTSAAGISWFMEKVADTGDMARDYAIHSHQEVDHVLDRNKALATHNDGYTPSREGRRVASIPMALIQKWKAEEGWDAFDPEHADKLAQKLNSSEYAHLRTAPGRIGVSNGIMR